MPTIEAYFQEDSGDTRQRATISQTPITYFPANVDSYETESDTPYLRYGMPLGGTESSAGRIINRGFYRFSEVTLPRGSHIEKATVSVFARMDSAFVPNINNGVQTMEFFWDVAQNPTDTAQDSPYGTEAWNYPMRDAKGTFTIKSTESTLTRKEADVTKLIQDLSGQFDFDREELLLRIRNKTFEDTVEAFPYPRPTPTLPDVSTQFHISIYTRGQGGGRSPRLTVTYRAGADTTISDDLSYTAKALRPYPERDGITGGESYVSRGMDDPNNFGDQGTADAHYPSSDTSVIRINAPFPDTSNRLDINCPPSTHNAGGTGDGNTGLISGGAISNLAWNYRFKIDITAFTINTDPTGQSIHIGLSDSDETVTSDLAQDYIGFKIATAGSASSFQLVGANGIGPDTGGAIEGTFTTPVTTGVFFVELTRNGDAGAFTNISCALFNDKDYTDLIERVNGITPKGISGLTYLKFMSKNVDGTGNGLITVEYGQRTSQPVSDTGRFTLVAGTPIISGQTGKEERHGRSVQVQPTIEVPNFSESFDILPRFDDFFSTLGNWQGNGSGFAVDTGQQVLDWTGDVSTSNNQIRNQLQVPNVVSDGAFIIRYKLEIENFANGTNATSNGVWFGWKSTSSGTNAPWSNIGTSVGMIIFVNDSTASFNVAHSTGTGPNSVDDNLVPFTTAVPSASTFYIEMKKTNATTFTVSIFSDKYYTQLIETQTATVVPFNSLRAFALISRDDGTGSDSTVNGFIDDVQFFNGETSFPSIDWDRFGIRQIVNQTTGKMDWDSFLDGTNHSITHDLGTPVSDTKWTMRFKWIPETLVAGSTRSKFFWIGLFSGDAFVDSETVQDAITFHFNVSATVPTGEINLAERDGVILTSTGTETMFTLTPLSGLGNIHFVELKRTSATTAECTIYSDPDYTTVIETVTLTIPAGITGLRYIGLKNRNDTAPNTGEMTGTIDNIQFWNGTDSLELDNTWTEVNT